MKGVVNNRVILRNAGMLVVRMVVVTLLGLYTARVVFAQLGEEDYGIFGAIGGVIAFMGFITASMGGATSRFITFAVGRGEERGVNEVFNASLMLHAGLAALMVIAGETVGLYLLNHVLKLPLHRMEAANVVYQITVLSAAVGIMQMPYEAMVMAYERMHIYSYLEVLNVGLKLLIVYLMQMATGDKLVTYSVLLLGVTVSIAMLYRWYCHRRFACCRVRFSMRNAHVRGILKFSTIDLYGNAAVTAKDQGMMYAVNHFFGTLYNASTSMALTVNGMLVSVAQTGTIVFTPQIIKQYSRGNLAAMKRAMENSIKFTLLAMGVLSVPFAVEGEMVFKMWLGTVPTYGVELLRIITLQSFFPVVNNVINSAIHATGNIKRLTYLNGSLFIVIPLATVLAFAWGGGILWAIGMDIILLTVIIGSAFRIVHRLIPGLDIRGLLRSLTATFVVLLVSLLPVAAVYNTLTESTVRLLFEAGAYFGCVGALSWFFLFSKGERSLIIGKLREVLQPIPGLLWRGLR